MYLAPRLGNERARSCARQHSGLVEDFPKTLWNAHRRSGKLRSMGEPVRSRVSAAIFAGNPRVAATPGVQAARAWLAARGLTPPALTRWHATILLGTEDRPPELEIDERRDTRFRIEIYSEEWGFFFCHGGHSSWIRVTDIAFVHGRDDFHLLGVTPALVDLGKLLRRFESDHSVRFQREHAVLRTNLDAEAELHRWVRSL
jgi:hypothetical protein